MAFYRFYVRYYHGYQSGGTLGEGSFQVSGSYSYLDSKNMHKPGINYSIYNSDVMYHKEISSLLLIVLFIMDIWKNSIFQMKHMFVVVNYK